MTIESTFGVLPSDIAVRLQSLAETFKVDLDRLYSKWEALAVQNQNAGQPTHSELDQLQISLRREQEKHYLKLKKVSTTPSSVIQKRLEETPVLTHDSLESLFSPSAKKFADRTLKSQIDTVYNPHIPHQPSTNPPASIALAAGQQIHGYRFMYEKLVDRGDVLDERLNQLAHVMRDYLKSMDAEFLDFADASSPSQETVITFGRLVIDSPEEAKMDETNVALELSKDIGNGRRVRLNFSSLADDVCLFPGRIVALQGVNPSGRLFAVSKIIPLPLLDMAASNADTMAAIYQKQTSPVNIIVAAGPYALDDSLAYEPLEELVQVVEKEQPDVVILLGPFVDSVHPLVSIGYMDVSLEELFANEISTRVSRMQKARPGIQVILIPSLRDAVSPHMCLPQPPLGTEMTVEETKSNRKALGLTLPNVLLFPNPVVFKINELVVAVNTADILQQLAAEEYFRGNSTDRLARLAQHIVEQRDFYPVYPSNEYISRPLEQSVRADIYIFATKMRSFVKGTDSLFVNPGSLSKGRQGGGYARLCIHGLQTEGLEGDVLLPHVIPQRTRVDIMKL